MIQAGSHTIVARIIFNFTIRVWLEQAHRGGSFGPKILEIGHLLSPWWQFTLVWKSRTWFSKSRKSKIKGEKSIGAKHHGNGKVETSFMEGGGSYTYYQGIIVGEGFLMFPPSSFVVFVCFVTVRRASLVCSPSAYARMQRAWRWNI